MNQQRRTAWEKLPVAKGQITPDAGILRRECAEHWDGNVTRMAEDLEVTPSTMRNYITGSSSVPYDVVLRCTIAVNPAYREQLGRGALVFDLRMPLPGSHYVNGQFVEPGTAAHEIISAVLERLRDDDPHCHDPVFTRFRMKLDPLGPLSPVDSLEVLNRALQVQGDDPELVGEISDGTDKSEG